MRVKVLQALFAYQRSGDSELGKGEKHLKLSLERIYDLYIHQLSLILEVRTFAKNQLEEAKKKKLPTAEDLNPSMRFVENPVVNQLENNWQLQKEIDRAKISWADHSELIRRIFLKFKEDDLFIAYMQASEVSYKEERRVIFRLFEDYIVSNEHLQSIFEEKSIFWVNDFEQVSAMVVRTLSDFKKDEETSGALPSIYKDEKEDKDFVLDLFRKTATYNADFQKMIENKLQNWDLDRIASIDMLLMKMAICEFLYIGSVPTRVTMNEYIEISKEYSTPKSKGFINGILDKLLFEMKEEGKIKKVGKGLIGG